MSEKMSNKTKQLAKIAEKALIAQFIVERICHQAKIDLPDFGKIALAVLNGIYRNKAHAGEFDGTEVWFRQYAKGEVVLFHDIMMSSDSDYHKSLYFVGSSMCKAAIGKNIDSIVRGNCYYLSILVALIRFEMISNSSGKTIIRRLPHFDQDFPIINDARTIFDRFINHLESK